MKIIIFTFICLLGAASALIQPGPCPTKYPVMDFNLTAHLGTWYEIERYDYDDQFDADCVTVTFIQNGDGSLSVEHQLKFYPDLYTVVQRGSAALSFPDEEPLTGSFNVTFDSEIDYGVNYIIIFTNYDEYSIAWNCVDHPEDDNHSSELWIMTRSPNLTEELQLILETYVDTFFDRVGLRETLQGRVCLAGASPF